MYGTRFVVLGVADLTNTVVYSLGRHDLADAFKGTRVRQ